MNESKHPRAVIGLVILAVLLTMLLGLQERRSAPMPTTSPLSPLDAGARALPGLRDQSFEGTLFGQLSQRAQRAQPSQPSQGAQLPQGTQERSETRAFWLKPWPWIGIGLVGFGLLAWGLLWGMRRMERD